MPDIIMDWFEPTRLRMVEKFKKIVGTDAFNNKKIDLGGFNNQNKGFISVNIINPCDIKHDLNIFPYPFEDDSIGIVIMGSTIQHLKYPREVIEEIHRMCVNGAYIMLDFPYYKYKTILFNPGHHHDFKWQWFRNLDGFKIMKWWHFRGRKLIWRKYHTYVVLKVVK